MWKGARTCTPALLPSPSTRASLSCLELQPSGRQGGLQPRKTATKIECVRVRKGSRRLAAIQTTAVTCRALESSIHNPTRCFHSTR